MEIYLSDRETGTRVLEKRERKRKRKRDACATRCVPGEKEDEKQRRERWSRGRTEAVVDRAGNGVEPESRRLDCVGASSTAGGCDAARGVPRTRRCQTTGDDGDNENDEGWTRTRRRNGVA